MFPRSPARTVTAAIKKTSAGKLTKPGRLMRASAASCPTMIKLKSKQQAKEAPVVGPSLAERLNQARAEAEAFIEAKVAELKASPEGQPLPIDWLRQDLRKRHGGSC